MAMHDPPDEGLLRLAERIADGDDLDWDGADVATDPETSGVRQLRAIDGIRRAHRALVADDLPGATWGPLDLRDHLASGGFGDVYLAHDRNLDRTVALKLLIEDDDEVASTRFVQEARRLASVDHTNVVTVHGVDRHEGRLGMWMERLEGSTLDAWVRQHGTMAASEAAVVGIELCRALAAVHGADLVHRDLKLSNVVRERGGRVVLMDFGSSSRRSTPPADALSGTIVYLAPEVFEGRDSGPRVDLYALGVLLYRLTGGDYPFDADEIRKPPAERRPKPLLDLNPDLSAAFVRVVERAMHPDPDRRFASAGEMERALVACLAPPEPAPAPRPTPRRGRRVAIAVAAAVVLGLAGLAYRSFLVPFEADATFMRKNAWDVAEPLVDGATIQPGDRLLLEVDTDRPSWLYVINADARGEHNLLFPIPGLEITNPVPGGTHEIPGKVHGAVRYWNVTSTGGRETLLAIASPRPVPFLEDRIRGLQPAAPGVPIRLAEADVDITSRMRGIGGLTGGPGDGSGRSPDLEAIQRAVSVESGSRGDVRVWELNVLNPE